MMDTGGTERNTARHDCTQCTWHTTVAFFVVVKEKFWHSPQLEAF